jgi:hypothetical protein
MKTTAHHRIAAGLTALAAVVTVGLAAPAAHADAPANVAARPTVQTDTNRERLQVACARIPLIKGRVDKAIALIQGDASVRGSLEWLQAKIDQATAAGRTDIVTLLQNRLATRQQRLVLLQARQSELQGFTDFCASKGITV